MLGDCHRIGLVALDQAVCHLANILVVFVEPVPSLLLGWQELFGARSCCCLYAAIVLVLYGVPLFSSTRLSDQPPEGSFTSDYRRPNRYKLVRPSTTFPVQYQTRSSDSIGTFFTFAYHSPVRAINDLASVFNQHPPAHQAQHAPNTLLPRAHRSSLGLVGLPHMFCF